MTLAEKLRLLADADDGDALETKERKQLKEVVDGILLNNRIENQVMEMLYRKVNDDEFTDTNCPVCHYWPCKCPRG